MDNCRDWERKPLINELTQGKELVHQLRIHLNHSSSTAELLVERILASYTKALLMLNSCGSDGGEPAIHQALANTAGMSDSPGSAIESPRSDESDRRDMYKKRKTLPRWTEQVRVCSGTGLEGPLEDGYSWRKYGQKDILGAKHPRGYYRCTHRNVQGCLATKQVQRSDENPSVFDVTYRGRHTCVQASHLISTSQSPNRVDPKENNQEKEKPKQPQEVLLNFKTGLRVKTEDLDGGDKFISSSFSFPSTPIECSETENYISSLSLDHNFNMGSFSPSFLSPATSESNYFSPCRTNIISAATSATNSPILDVHHFNLDPVDFDPNIPFDASFFFT